MDLTIRQAQEGDIPGVGEVYRIALAKGAGDHGFARKLKIPSRVNPFYEFCLRTDPEGFWVALGQDGAVAGATMSWVRGSHWFLSHLFIHPDHQARHVGRSLLEKTLQYAASRRCSTRSVITSAYNPVSIALYAKHGMYPQQALYSIGGMPEKAFLKGAARRAVSGQAVSGEEYIDVLAAMDQRLMGMHRSGHHVYLLLEQQTPCCLFYRGSELCGYAYVSQEGHIGPMACVCQGLFEDMLAHAILLAHEGGREVSMMVPGAGGTAMRVALEAGLEIRQPSVFMASQPFGDWGSFLVHSPALM